MVELNIECVEANGTKCDDLIPEAVICEQGPSELVMLLNGGDCSQSFNIQPEQLFQCFDFSPPNGVGPPPKKGLLYVEAQASKGSDPYFEGMVEVGTSFALTAPPGGKDKLAADTSVLIREGPGGPPMQLINFHTSCSRNLFLKDKYGAIQVIGWTNEEQGTVSCLKNVTYNYTIENTGVVDAELLSLTTFLDPPGTTVNLTEAVVGQILESGGNFSVAVAVQIDLITATPYLVEAELVGKSPGDVECADSDSLKFVAGGNGVLPDETPAPTVSPAPTPNTIGQSCVLEASAECILENGAPCSLLSVVPPNETICILPNGPTELGFIYRGSSCASSTATQGFECRDVAGGPSNIPEVSILVLNAAGEEVFRGLVSLNGAFVIPAEAGVSLGDEISITIATGPAIADIVQAMSAISVGCVEADNLTLGSTFGALEFTSYRDDEVFVSGVQPVQWNYTATNVGFPTATLTRFRTTTNNEEISQDEGDILTTGQSLSVTVPSEISLISSATYTGEVRVSASTPGLADAPCGATASSSVVL